MGNQKASNLTFTVPEVIKICILVFAIAGIWYKLEQSIALNKQVAASLNNTNKQLFKKGIIDDVDFVEIEKKDNLLVAEVDPKDIIDQKKRRRITYKQTAFDDSNYETIITK